MIMTRLMKWNMKTLNTKMRIVVKKISKKKTIQKAKITKVRINMKMKI